MYACISPSTLFIKTKIVLDDVLVPLHHETSASVPSNIVALITPFPQPSWTAVIIIIIIIMTQPGLLSNRNPAFGES